MGAALFVLRVRIFSICNPLVLNYAARGPHFVTSDCVTNVASVERIIFAIFICAIFSRFKEHWRHDTLRLFTQAA